MAPVSLQIAGRMILTSLAMAAFTVGFLPQMVAPAVQPIGLWADSSLNRASLVSFDSSSILEDTPVDENLAALTVYLEARGESFAGKLAVAAVIRNRMKMKYHSDGTIKGTVLRRKQFQPWNRRRPHQVRVDMSQKHMQDSLLAWRLVQDGRNVVDGAVLFYNPRIARTPGWATVGHKVATIGGHEFYIPKKHQT